MDCNISQINTTISLAKPGLCFDGIKLDANCVYQNICTQYSSYFKTFAISLVIAYIVIDIGLGWIVGALNHIIPWDKVAKDHPLQSIRPYLVEKDKYNQVELWLKDRLLLAFGVFCLMIALY